LRPGTLLGDMDSLDSRAMLGDTSSAAMKAVFKQTEYKLSRLIRLLCVMVRRCRLNRSNPCRKRLDLCS